jgi:hypothetical protein
MADPPPLPVVDYPEEFLDYIRKNSTEVGLFSAYPDRTVLEIQECLKGKPTGLLP